MGNKLKANELRCGNYFASSIDLKGSWIEKQRLSKNIFFVNQYTFQEFENHQQYFIPIPLRDEWLIMFGFFEVAGEFYKYFDNKYDDQYKRFSIFKDIEGIFRVYFYKAEIKYVHQLQNLYHALTGEELTVKELVK